MSRPDVLAPTPRENRPAAAAVLLLSVALAAGGARTTVSWNDASRLAAVESLVDQRTFVIDRSIFLDAAGGDKLRIDEHFYTDKAPVPVLLMAAFYQFLQLPTGLVAADQPGPFAFWMTLGSSGLAFVVAVWCVFRLGGVFRLSLATRLAVTAVFGLGTLAPVYSRQVNGHIQLLAVSAALFLMVARLTARPKQASRLRLVGLGCLAGLAYTIDLGAGPLLFAGTLVWSVYRFRRSGCVAAYVLAALPWIALHHAVNYVLGGTFLPANSVRDYLEWPGSPLAPDQITGSWHHRSVGSFLAYAWKFLVGPRGFLSHDLPLALAVPGIVVLLWRRVPEWPELLLAAGWAGATWLGYALTSTNYSGRCYSVRWLVPLLAPGFYVLLMLLRHDPRCRPGFLILGAGGVALAAQMWPGGVWEPAGIPLFWPIQAAAVLSWLTCEAVLRLRKRKRREAGSMIPFPAAVEATERAAA